MKANFFQKYLLAPLREFNLFKKITQIFCTQDDGNTRYNLYSRENIEMNYKFHNIASYHV